MCCWPNNSRMTLPRRVGTNDPQQTHLTAKGLEIGGNVGGTA